MNATFHVLVIKYFFQRYNVFCFSRYCPRDDNGTLIFGLGQPLGTTVPITVSIAIKVKEQVTFLHW